MRPTLSRVDERTLGEHTVRAKARLHVRAEAPGAGERLLGAHVGIGAVALENRLCALFCIRLLGVDEFRGQHRMQPAADDLHVLAMNLHPYTQIDDLPDLRAPRPARRQTGLPPPARVPRGGHAPGTRWARKR